jgi:uncharacterized protein YjbJ (UPF0337 family)
MRRTGNPRGFPRIDGEQANACAKGEIMGINKDQVDGRMKEAAGKVQEVAGRVTGNHTQEAKGAINKNLGAAEAKVGDVTEKAKGALKDAQKDSERHTRDHR